MGTYGELQTQREDMQSFVQVEYTSWNIEDDDGVKGYNTSTDGV